jgi:multidrug efflux pump subunit AcrA (membrane-fusion protein)
LPSLLQRFRRIVAPPGRPGEAVGVPASGTELEGELEPVLERLDDIDAEASEMEAQASAEAQHRREDAARRAAAILAEARVAAEAERARAASELRTAAERSAAGTRVDAAREVERIESVREERVARLAGEVVACVRRSGR